MEKIIKCLRCNGDMDRVEPKESEIKINFIFISIVWEFEKKEKEVRNYDLYECPFCGYAELSRRSGE